MWADSLTLAEVQATLAGADYLESVKWATPLLRRTRIILDRLRLGLADGEAHTSNPLQSADLPLLFEIRFAHALALANLTAEYEHCAGVGRTTVDFRVDLDPPWLVELVSLRESQAFKKAAWKSGPIEGFLLHTSADDPRQSEEGEMLKAQDRIGAKVCDGNGKPIKFPTPNESISLLMVDARGYLGVGKDDTTDWRHLLYGPHGLRDHEIRYWTDPKTGTRGPIKGLFELSYPLPAACVLRERVHFIGFVCERDFAAGEIKKRAGYFPNPALFKNDQEALNVLSRWPVRRGS